MICSRRKKHEYSYTGNKCNPSRNNMQIYAKTWFVDCRSLIVECNKDQSERWVGRGVKSQVTYIISRVTQG
jgi:hypothetical protein